MSIKPKYVKRIMNNTKKFEFRKVIFKNNYVKKVLIYSSSPEKKIVGYFEIDMIIKKKPEDLWHHCQQDAGIDKDEFFKYFKGKEIGFAIKIKKVIPFKEKVEPQDVIPNFHPPQSYSYTNIFNQKKLTQYV